MPANLGDLSQRRLSTVLTPMGPPDACLYAATPSEPPPVNDFEDDVFLWRQE